MQHFTDFHINNETSWWDANVQVIDFSFFQQIQLQLNIVSLWNSQSDLAD